MLEEVLYINIGRKNGLYTFENDNFCNEIPEMIKVNTPFYNEENSFEELLDVILEEPEEKVVFSCSADNYLLVKQLAQCLSEEYEKKIIIVSDVIENEIHYVNDGRTYYLINNFDTLQKLQELKTIINANVWNFLEKFNNNTPADGYYLSMKNGYDAFMTGVYPESLTNTLAKHVKTDNFSHIDDLSSILDLNGALLIDSDCELENDDNYNHVHSCYKDKVNFDKYDLNLKRDICSFTEFDKLINKNALNQDTVYYLKIENEEDLVVFGKELQKFKKDGKISTLETHLVDECRWTNECSLKRLVRYEINRNKIRPCLTSEVEISSLDVDDYDKLIAANKLSDTTRIERKCISCDMNSFCSKCACLARDIKEDLFCEFIHKNYFVKEYLIKKRIVQFLGRYSNVFAGCKEITVSSSARGLEYPVVKEKIQKENFIYILKKDDAYYYFNIQHGNLVKIEKKYVFLLEAWALGEEGEDIISNMALCYNLSENIARKAVEEGYIHLINGGLINE